MTQIISPSLVEEEGAAACRIGMARADNPYPQNSPEHALWDAGWCDEDERHQRVLTE